MATKQFPSGQLGRVGQDIYQQEQNLLIGQIKRVEAFQMRPELRKMPQMVDPGHVEDIRQAIREGKEIKSIRVFLVDGVYYLTRGNHRYVAHLEENKEVIKCQIVKGTWDEALQDAAEGNLEHSYGMPLGTEGKKEVMRIMCASKWADWSLRRIAAELQVKSPDTVARWWDQLSDFGQLPARPEAVVGKDGVARNIVGIRDAAQNRQQDQLLADSDPAWKADRAQIDAAKEALRGKIAEVSEAWQAAIDRETEHAEDVKAANEARFAAIKAKAEHDRLTSQLQTLENGANEAIAIKQWSEEAMAKRIQAKLAVAVEKGWIDADQAELHRWEELRPLAFDFRLRNMATGEIIDPHTRPADRVLEQKRAMEAAVDTVNRAAEEVEDLQMYRNRFNQWMTSLKLMPFFLGTEFLKHIHPDDVMELKRMIEDKMVLLMRFWEDVEKQSGAKATHLAIGIHEFLMALDE